MALYLGVPFGNILGPFLTRLFKRDTSPFVESQAKGALNFQISITVYGVVAGFLSILLVGVFLVPLVFVLQIVLTVVAAVRASKGRAYRYPLTVRLIA